jgi:monovalent cation:H+ antiporter-2, CPA2 family
MHHDILVDVLLLLATTVAVVGLFRLLHIPAIIGYLTVGVLVGPNGLAWLVDAAEIRFLAELGIVFLLFMVGLEFSLPVLVAARGTILGFGGAQVLLTGGLAAGLIYAATDLSLSTSVLIGGALAMSSTAIVLRQLTEQGELATRHGRLAVSVLVFQDLAVLPFLVAIPVLGVGSSTMALALLVALAKAALAFGAMLAVGRWLISPIIDLVARARSRDFFVLSTLLLILCAAAVADFAGLSLAIGAFLAGIVVGETPFKHFVEDEMRVFRDVLLGLFFVTIGMQLDPPAIVGSWATVAIVLSAILLSKPLLILALYRLGNTHPGVIFRVGICLGHVGEFGLLIMSFAIGQGLIGGSIGQPVLAAMVLSMMVAPLAIRWNGFGVQRWNFLGYQDNLARQEVRAARASKSLDDHVIVCGYGRYGQHLIRFLELEGVPYVAMDTDPEIVRRARNAHKRVIYGYAARFTLLESVGVRRARALAITFLEHDVALKIVRQVHPQLPDLPILVRAADVTELEVLEGAGASDVLPESLEASIQLAAQLLLILGVPHSRVEEHTDTVRGDQYRLLRGELANRGREEVAVGESTETLRTVHVADNSWMVGCTLKEFESRGLSVVSLRRAGVRVPEIGMDTPFRPRDILVIAGHPSALLEFETLAPAKEAAQDTHPEDP